MTFWGVIHGAVCVVSVVAGISILRDPIRAVWVYLAALAYFAGAGFAFYTGDWWPLLAGWLAALAFLGVKMIRLLSGAYSDQVDVIRAARALPPR